MATDKAPCRRAPLTLAVCGAASLAFALMANYGSYRAQNEIAVYLLFGVLMFLSLFFLWRDGYLEHGGVLAISIAAAAAAFALRICFIDYRSGDYNSFLVNWVQFYRENGGFAALDVPVGDYNLPYLYLLAFFSYIPIDDLYLIKLSSVAFDVLAAFFALRLTSRLTESLSARLTAYFAVLLLPTVFLNSALWAQCDSIYTAFALGALYFAFERRPVLAMLFGAVSFAFKLQAVFLLPVFAVFLMLGHIKWRHVPLFPAFYAVMALPAIIAGRPPLDAILIYVHQAGEYSSRITLNAPNFAVLFKDAANPQPYALLLVVLAFLFLAALLAAAFLRRESLDDRGIMLLTLAMCIGIPFFLPYMHERYFYIAEVLSVVCACAGAVHFTAPVLVQAASMICYDAYLNGFYRFRHSLAAMLMAAALTVVTATVVMRLFGRRTGGSETESET